MKILCIADDKDALVYSAHVKDFYPEIDMVIGAGDLSLRYYEYIITSLNKPLLFVFGNHNLEHYKYYMGSDGRKSRTMVEMVSNNIPYGGTVIEDLVYRDKKSGLIVAGLGGSINYNKGKHQFTNSQMARRMWRMAPRLIVNKILYGRCLDILVTHAAPLGLNDDVDPCHVGFKSFLTFMDIFKPKYLLHGHIHLTDANAKRDLVYKRTKIINVYKSFVLDDDFLGKRRFKRKRKQKNS
ncbi:MAG: metallophosphoesterase [Spirochaetaceae bacterium]|nr:metallophosphoesterase [Spirochaetaceae bacterium]